MRFALFQQYIQPPPQRSPSAQTGAMVFAANTISLGFISFLLLWRNQDHILFSTDLYQIFANYIQQLEKGPLFSLTMNLLVYGNIDDGINPRLMPAFALAALVPAKFTVAAVYTGFSVERFICVFIAARLFRLSALVAAVSAWTACVGFIPYHWPYFVWIELSVIVPSFYTASSVYILFAGIFYDLGKRNILASVLSVIILTLLSFYIVVALLQYSIVIFFMLAWTCAGIALVSWHWKELIWKGLAGLVVVSLFLGLGVIHYIDSYYSHNWYYLIVDPDSSGSTILRNLIDPESILAVLKNFNFYNAFLLARLGLPAVASFQFAIFTLASAVSIFLFLIKFTRSANLTFSAGFFLNKSDKI
jgi:hypothetical protein